MAKKSKKDKTKKKPKAPPKPKPKPKPKRQNPNQVKRIPAKVGATSRANITQVVAPTGARGGVDSYKKRSKEEILAEKIAKAQATLGLQQQTAPQPVIQRPRGVVKPPAVVGGYTGLTSGFGIKESSKKLDEKLKNMEDRILNEVKKQTNPAAVNAEDTKSRTNSLIQEVSSRNIETQTETKPSSALVASRLRARNKNNNFNRFTPILPSDADVEKDKQLEREEKEKQDEAKLQIRKDEKEAEQKYVGLHTLRMNKDKNVKKKAVNSILDNILTNVIETADTHVLEKQNQKQERDRAIQQKQQMDLETQVKQIHQDTTKKQQMDLEAQVKQIHEDTAKKQESEKQAKMRMEQASQERKEREEQSTLSREKARDEIGDEVRKAEVVYDRPSQVISVPQVQVDVGELIEMGGTQISGEQVEDSIFEDLPIEGKMEKMLETTGEMEDIIEQYPQPVSQETLQKARDKHPLPPPSRSSISTQTSAVEQSKPSRGQELKDRAEAMKETRRPKWSERFKPLEQEKLKWSERFKPKPELPPRDIERPLPTPPDKPVPKPAPPSDKKNIAKSALSSIIDSSFDRAVKKAKERKVELKEEARQQRIQRDLQIKKEQQLRTQRGDERMKRDRNKRTSLLAATSVLDDILTKTEKEIDLQETRKAIQAESKLRKVGQGRKKLVEQSLKLRDVPDELKDLMKFKDSLKDDQRKATSALSNLGLNNKTIPYNARNLTIVRNHRDDDTEKEKIRQLYENHRDPQIQKLLPDVMKLVQELLTAKRESKKIQDRITRMRKKAEKKEDDEYPTYP